MRLCDQHGKDVYVFSCKERHISNVTVWKIQKQFVSSVTCSVVFFSYLQDKYWTLVLQRKGIIGRDRWGDKGNRHETESNQRQSPGGKMSLRFGFKGPSRVKLICQWGSYFGWFWDGIKNLSGLAFYMSLWKVREDCLPQLRFCRERHSPADGRWQQWHHPWGPSLLSHYNDLGAVAACVPVTARKHAKAKRNQDKKDGSFLPLALLSAVRLWERNWHLTITGVGWKASFFWKKVEVQYRLCFLRLATCWRDLFSN